MKDSFSQLSLSLGVVLGLSLAVSGQPSQVEYTGGRDASNDAGKREIMDPGTLSTAASGVGNTYSNDSNVVDPLDRNIIAHGPAHPSGSTDRLPEPLGMVLIGEFLTFLGIALDRKHGPARRD